MSHAPESIIQSPAVRAAGMMNSTCDGRSGLCGPNNGRGLTRNQLENDYLRSMSRNDPDGMISACIGIITCCLAERGDLSMLLEWTEELGRLHAQVNGGLPPAVEVELVCCMVQSLTHHIPGHPDLVRWVGRARQIMQTVPEAALQIELASVVVPYYWWIGESFELRRVVEDLLPLPESLGDQPAAMIRLLAIRAQAAAYFGEPEEAVACVESARSLATVQAVEGNDPLLLMVGASAALMAGKRELAHSLVAGMQKSKQPYGEIWTVRIHAMAAWEALASGRFAEARSCLREVFELSGYTDCPFIRLLPRLLASQLNFDDGETEQAFKLLNDARQIGRDIQSRLCAYVCGLVESYFLLVSEPENPAGLKRLHVTLALGRTDDFACHPGLRRELLTYVCIKALENGIELKQAQKIISAYKLMPATPPIELEQWPWPLKIYTMGRFSLVREGLPLSFAGKIQKKPMEMLKALIAFGGRNVSEERLCDQLWSNAAGDDAHKSYVVTLHRLRRLLGDERFLLNGDGLLSLNQRCCWVDVWAFNRHAGRAQAQFNGGAGAFRSPAGEACKAIALYTGHFLAGDSERQWALPMRERLRGRLLSIIRASGLFWEQAGEWRRAAECYQKGIETDDLVEEHYQRLMTCQWQMGDRGAVLSSYRRCCSALTVYGVKPSPATIEVYETCVYGPTAAPLHCPSR